MSTEPTIDDRELSQALGIGVADIELFIRRGLPHTVADGQRRYEPVAVRAWLISSGAAEPARRMPVVATTRAEAAEALGVSTRTISQWCEERSFPGRAGTPGKHDGYFPIAEIEAWHTEHFGSKAKVDYSPTSRNRMQDARADILEIERNKLLGELISTDEVERLHQRVASGARSVLEQLPDRLCSGAPEEDKPRLRRIGERVRDDTLAAMAELLNRDEDED